MLTKTAAPVVQSRGCSSRRIIRSSVGVLAAVNTVTYWYTIYTSDLSLVELFVPKYLIDAPVETDAAMRTIIQYDYICCFGAALLWLAFVLRDLKEIKNCGSVQVLWALILVLAVALSGVCGVGTMLLVGWTWREEILAKKEPNETRKNK